MPCDLIGRKMELDALRRALARPALLTVMGTAGIGKSAVVAAAVVGREVCWVDVDDDALPDTVAPVIVLDGADGWSRRVADHVQAAIARGAVVVATSRDLLALRGEQVFALPPLGIPDPARALFDRRVARGGGSPVARERADALIHQLGGLPLGLELAAARVADLGMDRVEQTLGRSLDDLARRGVRMVRRMRIRHVVDWAVGLLDSEERRALARVLERGGRVAEDDADVPLLARRGLAQPHPWEPGIRVVPPLVEQRLRIGSQA